MQPAYSGCLLSVVVPVYNEVADVASVLRAVELAPLPDGMARELIVIDDASTDGTSALLQQIDGIQLYRLSRNQGKGVAVRQGLEMARGDFVLIQDADLEYSPSCYRQLLQPLLEGRCEVVYGSRFLGQQEGMVPLQYLGNRILTATCNLFFGSQLTDSYTCYKVFRRSALDFPLSARRFELEAELTAKFLLRGRRIIEIPISYSARQHAQGKKIRARDGFRGLWCLLLCRLGLL